MLPIWNCAYYDLEDAKTLYEAERKNARGKIELRVNNVCLHLNWAIEKYLKGLILFKNNRAQHLNSTQRLSVLLNKVEDLYTEEFEDGKELRGLILEIEKMEGIYNHWRRSRTGYRDGFTESILNVECTIELCEKLDSVVRSMYNSRRMRRSYGTDN